MVPCFRRDEVWIPACAGMTDEEVFQRAKVLQFFYLIFRSFEFVSKFGFRASDFSV